MMASAAKGGGHKDNRSIGSSSGYRLGDGVEDGHAFELLAALARRHPPDHLGAVFDHLAGVEGTLAAGYALYD